MDGAGASNSLEEVAFGAFRIKTIGLQRLFKKDSRRAVGYLI